MESSLASTPSDLQILIKKYSRFLIEVRKRLLFTLSVFAIGTVVGFVYVQNIIRFLVNILSLRGINIVFTSPFQFINLSITCGIATGLIVAFPLIIAQMLSFLRPALRAREYKLISSFLPFCLVLFLVGFGFGAVIMKWQIQIFLVQSTSLGIGNMLDISRLLSVVIITSALMGLAFQSPIVLLILLRIGILKHPHLSKARPWVYLGSFIFSILLPADSILADILLTLPLVVLFEITLIVNNIFERRKTGLAVQEGA